MSKLSLSLLLGLLARAAGDTPVCVDAALDRREYVDQHEGFAVLDVAEYPSINVPLELAKGIPEGAPIKVCASVQGNVLEVFLTRDLEREKHNRKVIQDHHKEKQP